MQTAGVLKLAYLVPILSMLFASRITLAAPITFNTALPVAKSEFILREQLIVNQSDDDSSILDRDRRATSLVSVLGYGVNSKLALFGMLPYHDNRLMTLVDGQHRTRAASGFGDLTVFGRYTLVQRNKQGRTFRVAPFAGIKAPTGDDDKRDNFGRLPPSVQTGSGSWDPFAGLVLTYQTLGYQIDGQFSVQVRNEANGLKAGDLVRLDTSLQYRLIPRILSAGLPNFLYAVIEANLIHQAKSRINHEVNPNSGGTRLFLTPGLQYVTKRWIAEAALQIPVSQNLNGTALEQGYSARISVRLNF